MKADYATRMHNILDCYKTDANIVVYFPYLIDQFVITRDIATSVALDMIENDYDVYDMFVKIAEKLFEVGVEV